MSFASPLLLWLFPLLILVAAADLFLRNRRAKRLERFMPQSIRERTGSPDSKAFRRFRSLLFYLGCVLILFSLSRPQWGYSWREAQREGLDLMVAVDTSNSMRADDFRPTRLQRAKWGLEDLVAELDGDRVGLMAFAGVGNVLAPLTLDYAAFLMSVNDLFPGIVPKGGTNLQAALEKAADSFDAESESDKVILLITDGESHQGNLGEILRRLKENRIRVFAVGVGTPEGSLIPLDPNANNFLKNQNDEVVKSNLNEEVLKKLAAETDGLYVRANPRDFGVSEIITEGLQPLKRAELESERVKEMEERFQIFLSAGLLLLFLEALSPLPRHLLQRRRAGL